ncbi:conserved oligomeric Golgi complex subunit 6-like [Mytilus edulis]|uniref:conserved oligomeric Golgi complex subunit 6-like n=2 Tax=Mytilus TaxID=6548 RepID=UPI0039F0A40C
MDPLATKSAMNKFDSYLASPDSLGIPQCGLILSARVRENVKRQSVDLICGAYKQMYEAVCKPENDYKEPQGIVPRTPEQVVKLLS